MLCVCRIISRTQMYQNAWKGTSWNYPYPEDYFPCALCSSVDYTSRISVREVVIYARRSPSMLFQWIEFWNVYIRMTQRIFSTDAIVECLLFIDFSFVIKRMESLKVPLSPLDHHRTRNIGTWPAFNRRRGVLGNQWVRRTVVHKAMWSLVIFTLCPPLPHETFLMLYIWGLQTFLA
jgi:hypothetical protein